MEIIIGIDVGGSTTKIVGYDTEYNYISNLQVTANDPVTSVYGALGKFVNETKISLESIKKIMLTGVGASFFNDDIYGIETKKVNEFEAIGLGGLELSGKTEAIIVSMGTGTAYVRASLNKICHIGGSGVGGGTIVGLCSKLANATKFKTIIEEACEGNLDNIDLTIKDISKAQITTLPPEMTASNFGKISDNATDSDAVLGVINMVFQTIGMLAVFATKNDTTKDIVLTGTLTKVPQTKEIFNQLNDLYGVNFIIPENALYATAMGAALSYFKDKNN